MNLLKQTALVLGLVSLGLGGVALFKNWRQKIAIMYAILCFIVAGWALSFVSHATLGGRLSKDIHWLFNLWLAPVGVSLISKFLSVPDGWGKWLVRISSVGAATLSLAIMFSVESLTQLDSFWFLVKFWPSFILIEYLHVMFADLVYRRPVDIDFISSAKRKALYAGLGISMAICTFDHIPQFGFLIPSMGNLLFAVYLTFANMVLNPQRILGLEALLSRFFAILILSLVITGYFALLYQYMSETFGLFLLNSFLLSVAILMLWTPLITFFRVIGAKLSKNQSELRREWVDRFKMDLDRVTSQVELNNLLESFFSQTLKSKAVRFEQDPAGVRVPSTVLSFFMNLRQRRDTPILYRSIIQMERDQVLTQERKTELDQLLQYLDLNRSDLVFPVFTPTPEAVAERTESSVPPLLALVLVDLPTSLDEWNVTVGFYSMIYEAVQDIALALMRIQQVESAMKKERLALLGEMSAGLAHEIRNPLGAIKGASELLGQNPDPKWAKVIREEVDRLNRLVSQFLDFAHTSADRPESRDLFELLEKTVSAALPALPSGVSIELIPPSKRMSVWVVPDQIQQVVLNLLYNAVKAVEGRPDPKIEFQTFETGFRITDNGVGMSEETLSRVFQPFFSAFKAGSGLGMSICQRLVHANDGTIQVQSRLGEGTTVKVNLCETKSSSLMTNPI